MHMEILYTALLIISMFFDNNELIDWIIAILFLWIFNESLSEIPKVWYSLIDAYQHTGRAFYIYCDKKQIIRTIIRLKLNVIGSQIQ